MTQNSGYDFEKLQATLEGEARTAFQRLNAKIGKEKPYVYAFVPSSSFVWMQALANTEDVFSETGIRWNPGDWEFSSQPDDFKDTDELLKILAPILDAQSPDEWEKTTVKLNNIFISVLKSLDREGIFDKKSSRSKVVVACLFFDDDTAGRMPNVRLLNSKEVVSRFETESTREESAQ